MHRFFIFNDQPDFKKYIIPNGEIYKQVTKVLRIKNNEEFICIYKNYELTVILENDKFKVVDLIKFSNSKKYKTTLIQGVPTGKKSNLIIQKATELGVDEIVFWQAERSTADFKKFESKIERFTKIAIEACEQSRRNDIPSILYIESLPEFDLENKFTIVPYEDEKQITIKQSLKKHRDQNIVVIIGPEGGITKEEIDFLESNDSNIVTLGQNILRTETAAINALSVVKYEKDL